jgi:Fur family ferric uptake transcriptional regulator
MASLDWLRYVYDDLAVAGLHRGGARDRIIEVLSEQECAITPTEIEKVLRARGRPIARASIYRVLDLLVDRGLAERVITGQGEARVEPVEPSGHHHHHLYCGQCGRLVAFDDPGLERAIDRVSDRLGVTVDGHEILLRGACERCA